ncbi:MAG: fibrobacter succinogenes major paralogous domain-containing protein [Fibrobacter sp.]|nr:fibrobacter succinogenes major paralogous domain-containing protein [Fibrobacter sp.]
MKNYGFMNNAFLLLVMLLSLTACTDYEAVVEDNYEEWVASIEEDDSISNAVSGIDRESSSIKDGSEYDAASNTLKDKRNGQVYKTVTIGDQTWMAENLNYDYNEGTAKSFCYNNSTDSCAKYGRLYLWSAAMDSASIFSYDGAGCGYEKNCKSSDVIRGVCPEGWHLPSQSEWKSLIVAADGSSTAGSVFKSENAGGFSVLPAGYRDGNDIFKNVGDFAYFWSASQDERSSYYAYDVYLIYDVGNAFQSYGRRNEGLSVRCVMDFSCVRLSYCVKTTEKPEAFCNLDETITNNLADKYKQNGTFVEIYKACWDF